MGCFLLLPAKPKGEVNWGWCGEANYFVDREYCGANTALSDELIIWGLLPYPRRRQPRMMVVLKSPSFANGLIF